MLMAMGGRRTAARFFWERRTMADSTHDGVEARPSGGQADPLRQIFDLELLLDVARRLGSTVELDPLLAAIATAAISVLDCERATVFLYDAATNELYSRLATGMDDSKVKEIRFPVGQGIAGEVASSGCIINLPDAYADLRPSRPVADVVVAGRGRGRVITRGRSR